MDRTRLDLKRSVNKDAILSSFGVDDIINQFGVVKGSYETRYAIAED